MNGCGTTKHLRCHIALSTQLLDYSAGLLVSVPRNPNGPEMKVAGPGNKAQASRLKKKTQVDDHSETPWAEHLTLHLKPTH